MSNVTILKAPDAIDDKIAQLEDLHSSPAANKEQKSKILKEIKALRSGHNAEKTAHHLLSKLEVKNKSFLISDLRLDIDGDISQIDHLIVNKYGFISLFETKSFSTGIKVTKDGEFLWFNPYTKKYKQIPSPLKQSKRHEQTLLKALNKLHYQGITDVHHYVLIDYRGQLIKPKNKFRNVCRTDQLEEVFQQEKETEVKKIGLFDLPSATKTITKAFLTSTSYIETTFRNLVELHQPITINYSEKFGLSPASAYMTLTEVEIYFGIAREQLFKQLISCGLLIKGKYGWFASDVGKSEGLIMKNQGQSKTLFLPKSTIEKALS